MCTFACPTLPHCQPPNSHRDTKNPKSFLRRPKSSLQHQQSQPQIPMASITTPNPLRITPNPHCSTKNPRPPLALNFCPLFFLGWSEELGSGLSSFREQTAAVAQKGMGSLTLKKRRQNPIWNKCPTLHDPKRPPSIPVPVAPRGGKDPNDPKSKPQRKSQNLSDLKP